MKKGFIQFGIVAIASTLSCVAGASIVLTNQYTVAANAVNVGINQYQFNYSVTNNNQSSGVQTGLDLFTLFVPQTAAVLAATSPAPFYGAPGYWTSAFGNNALQGLSVPAGYQAYTWWGMNPQSVYPIGSTASFSITLGNVNIGTDTVGLTTYFGVSQPAIPYVSGPNGTYYSTFTGSFVSPVSVPEPVGMALFGTGLLMLARKRHRI